MTPSDPGGAVSTREEHDARLARHIHELFQLSRPSHPRINDLVELDDDASDLGPRRARCALLREVPLAGQEARERLWDDRFRPCECGLSPRPEGEPSLVREGIRRGVVPLDERELERRELREELVRQDLVVG